MEKKNKTKEENRIEAKKRLEWFYSLPERAQLLMFEFMECFATTRNMNTYTPFHFMDFSKCESEIEKILYMAYEIELFGLGSTMHRALVIKPQQEIKCAKTTYRADFLFDTESEYREDLIYGNDFRLVIECDGHDYHEKTKEQVRKNNERDMAIKQAGYDIIHFSGSQIYQEPVKCAHEITTYILNNVKEINYVDCIYGDGEIYG